MALLTEKLGLNFSDLVAKVNLGYERNKVPNPHLELGDPCLSKDPYILEDIFSKIQLRLLCYIICA